MATIKKGDCVKPLRRLKRPRGFWTRDFGQGKSYPIIDFDTLDGEKVLVLGTGDDPTQDYQIVYPDEVVKVKRGFCKRKKD